MENNIRAEKNSLSVWSLVFGIIAVLTSWTVIIGIPAALLAITFAALSQGRFKKSKQALCGTLLGTASILLAVIAAGAIVYFFGDAIVSYLGSPEDVIRSIFF